jgi:hypothetical protein
MSRALASFQTSTVSGFFCIDSVPYCHKQESLERGHDVPKISRPSPDSESTTSHFQRELPLSIFRRKLSTSTQRQVPTATRVDPVLITLPALVNEASHLQTSLGLEWRISTSLGGGRVGSQSVARDFTTASRQQPGLTSFLGQEDLRQVTLSEYHLTSPEYLRI